VTAPINWQIDYVVVSPTARGRGVGAALVKATLNEALHRNVPYVMLTSRESLRPLYEGCGFSVVSSPALV
jgi:predicted GNAT family N-acyltransferase